MGVVAVRTGDVGGREGGGDVEVQPKVTPGGGVGAATAGSSADASEGHSSPDADVAGLVREGRGGDGRPLVAWEKQGREGEGEGERGGGGGDRVKCLESLSGL